MSNEIVILLSVVVFYSLTIGWYVLFGSRGLICLNIIVTIAANIEVLILIKAFGITQTLGNVLFASTFLITDILSENHGKEEAKRAVNIGVAATVTFIIISMSWFLYTPAADNAAADNIRAVFSSTPRIMLVGVFVYAVCQRFDVWMYHFLWKLTEKKYKTVRGFLWLRNNAATLLSQLLNTVLFTVLAFAGTYGINDMISIAVSAYVIFIATSLLDTPFVYLARYMKEKSRIMARLNKLDL